MNPKQVSVLVVDDDVDICRNVADILGDLGYEVDMAHDGFSAMQQVRRRSYDLALLDLKMPGMDGLTLYREIRKIRAETVGIIITAYASPETADLAEEAGAWRILTKPVDFSLLLRLAEEALEQPLVLIVEDDPQLCDNLWRHLRERGFRVALANNGTTALTRLQQQVFRVVLIDLRVTEENSSTIIRLVRETNPQARTVLISAKEGPETAEIHQVLAEGADAVCYKPFDVPTLLGTVERLAGL